MLPTENVHCAYISKAHVFSFRWRCRFKTKNYTMDIIPFSKIRLVCPNPTTVATLTHYYPAEEEMYENVWIVDKNSYDACSVDAKNPANKIIFRCNKPSELNYHSIVFQMYSAIENGLEFTPGKTYYFICKFSCFSRQNN